MFYALNYDKKTLWRACLSVPEWPVMFYAWPGPTVWCKRSTEREHGAQPRCGPAWADMVEKKSLDLVGLQASARAVHACF